MRPCRTALAMVMMLAGPAYAESAPKPAVSGDARKLATGLHVREQIEFLIPRLSPLFAQQMLATVQQSNRFRAQIATPERREQLQAAFGAEFEQAFRAHLAEMVDAVASGI